MACRLCLKNLELKKSHIIPEAFWKELYDPKHRALPISTTDLKLKPVQKGFREKLLCGGCEQKLSKWEATLKNDLLDFGTKTSNYLNFKKLDRDILLVSNIRYLRFKLAVLSIIWRMSISKNNFYSDYYLGPYEEVLRQALKSEEHLDEKHFPIFISRYELDGEFYPGIIMGFPKARVERIFTVYKFVIWGHAFTIFINNKIFPNIPIEHFLRESGEVLVDTRSLVELASPESVLARVFEADVSEFYTS